MEDPKRIWVWVGVAVIVVVVVVWAVWGSWGLMRKPKTVSGPTPVFAPQGQLVSLFPGRLILDGSSSSVGGSYSVDYSSSTDQYTAEFDSSSSMLSVYASYTQYLPANGWTITNAMTRYASSRGLYASNASSDVAVGIVSQGKGSQVTVTYLIK